MSLANKAVARRKRFCRGCDYVLDALTNHRCPECGRPFDPDKRKTYRTHPYRQRVGTLLRIVVGLGGLALIIMLVVSAWIYSRYRAETRVLSNLQRLGIQYKMQTIGPAWLTRRLQDHGLPTFQTVADVGLYRVYLETRDLADLGRLTDLRRLDVDFSKFSDVEAGLRSLSNLKKLEWLDLEDTATTDESLRHLTGLTKLQSLILDQNPLTDNAAPHLKKLVGLTYLRLRWTQISEAGLSELRATLPDCRIIATDDEL